MPSAVTIYRDHVLTARTERLMASGRWDCRADIFDLQGGTSPHLRWELEQTFLTPEEALYHTAVLGRLKVDELMDAPPIGGHPFMNVS